MSNAAKLKKKAAEFEQKKQFDKALQLYIQILDSGADDGDEGDVALYNRVGDLLMRQGTVGDAMTYYEKAVDLYAESGFFNNAIALCNKILRQSPGRNSIYYKLGKISAKKGFISDAKQNFLEYASRMQTGGQLDEAFRALKEFADLCPDQDDIRLMLADQLSKKDRKGEALEQLQVLYREVRARGARRRHAGHGRPDAGDRPGGRAEERERPADSEVDGSRVPRSLGWRSGGWRHGRGGARCAAEWCRPWHRAAAKPTSRGRSSRSASRSTTGSRPRGTSRRAGAGARPAADRGRPAPGRRCGSDRGAARPGAEGRGTRAARGLDSPRRRPARPSWRVWRDRRTVQGPASEKVPELPGLQPLSGEQFASLRLATPFHVPAIEPPAHDLALPGELPRLGGALLSAVNFTGEMELIMPEGEDEASPARSGNALPGRGRDGSPASAHASR